MKVNPAFEAIRGVARALGLPKAFKRDVVVHDRRALRGRDGEPFLWALRESGSCLVWVSDELRYCHSNSARYVRAISKCHPESKWFLWDGELLSAVNADAAVEAAIGLLDRREGSEVEVEYTADEMLAKGL